MIVQRLKTRLAYVLAVALCGAADAQIAGGTFSTVGSDTVPRLFHAASTLPDGRVMVSGGLGLLLFPPSLFFSRQVSFFDPHSGAFSAAYTPLSGGPPTTPLLAVARSSHTLTSLLDGRVLIAGGDVGAAGTNPGAATRFVEIFDPYDGVMRAGPDMNTPRSAHTATLLSDGRVLVAGGASWQIFEPVVDAWSAPHALNHSRTTHAAVRLPDFAGIVDDERVALIGGAGSGPATIEMIDPLAESSDPLASTLTIGVDDLAAARMPDGRVFIVGGQNVVTGNTVGLAYVLDPAQDTIAPLANVPNRASGIADHQLARLRYAVILGGEQQVSSVDTILRYAAIFDLIGATWVGDGQMIALHDDFALTPLGGCRTLIIGGGVPLLGSEAPSAACETLEITLADACRIGDADNDGDIDFRDAFELFDCMTGPQRDPVVFACRGADLDGDDDVDVADIVELQRSLAP